MSNRRLPADFENERYGLRYRLVREEDAEFIYKLRSDKTISRFIHDIEGGVEQQREWIKAYKQREEDGTDYYFIYFKGGRPIGLNRIYSIHDKTFTTGSWVMEPGCSVEEVMAVPIISRETAFETFNLDYEDNYDACHIDNKKVIKFNLKFGCKIYKHFQDVKGEYVAMSLTKEDFEARKPKLLKLIGY